MSFYRLSRRTRLYAQVTFLKCRKGLSFIGCMTIHGVIALITFFESWINTPSESIPEPGSENKEDDDNKDEKSEDEGQLKIVRFRYFLGLLYT